ncbi:hypothetical protein TrVE_jg2938 [Triparma verrucosa]|uniref:tRNA/rRNA methyltransferase SpoU type domain-containing protein n=1 Tax=Triparma verrucosa TaxID=1606542 RepID=A0A9W7FCR3_9STRA|nr:hypothetical protein TrVE_jg2938 [Triparma verrucosa]
MSTLELPLDLPLPSFVIDLTSTKRSSPNSLPTLSQNDIQTYNLTPLTNLKSNDSHVKSGKYIVEGIENAKVLLTTSVTCTLLCLKKSSYITLLPFLKSYSTKNPTFKSYILTSPQLESLTTFPISRGCIGYGPVPPPPTSFQNRKIIALDKISDVSNLGTIIRTASNIGADVVLSSDCCNQWYRRSVRCSMGEVFRVKVGRVEDFRGWVEGRRGEGYGVYAASLGEGGKGLEEVTEVEDKWVVIFGNEGEGVRKEIEEAADHKVRIESCGDVDSYNVGVSVGIVGYWMWKHMKGKQIVGDGGKKEI